MHMDISFNLKTCILWTIFLSILKYVYVHLKKHEGQYLRKRHFPTTQISVKEAAACHTKPTATLPTKTPVPRPLLFGHPRVPDGSICQNLGFIWWIYIPWRIHGTGNMYIYKYIATWLVDFYRKCSKGYHTWILWVWRITLLYLLRNHHSKRRIG